MLRIYLVGLVVLGAAIVLNAAMARLGVLGWYDFLLNLQREGLRDGMRLRVLDAGWLFVGYPLMLGLAAALASHVADRVMQTVGVPLGLR